MVDGLVACTQQAIVTALDWVPTSNLVPPLTCARLAAEDMLRKYSWRKPLETLQTCVQLMLAKLIFYVAFILTAILWKRVLIGRFQTGAWDVTFGAMRGSRSSAFANFLRNVSCRTSTVRTGEWSSTASPACVRANECFWIEMSC